VKSSLGLVFYNSHPWNLIILMWFFLMDKRPLRILVLHEPLKKNKIRNFGIFAIKVFIVEWFNKLQSWLCTDIIVLSPYAKVLVESSFGYNPKTNIHEARILLDPLNVDPDILVKERKYASFIGNINGTKGLGGFYNLAHYSWANCYNHLFALVTGSTLSGKDRVVYDLNNITITQKSNLSDFEIEQWMTKSIVVFCLHKSVTQSGVLVECMRTATPIICVDEDGFQQFVKDSMSLVPSDYSNHDLIHAIEYTKANLVSKSKLALLQFNAEFSSECFTNYYDNLLGELKS